MKTLRFFAFALLLATVSGLAGCAKNENSNPDPGRAAFIGTWTVTPTKASYEVTISEDPNSSDGVFISNFYLIGLQYPPASASIKGTTITLDANQIIGDGLTVNGSGVLSGNRISWKYTIFDGADLVNVSETYTKR